MRYDAILFDMDGTVLNTLDDLHDSVNTALRQFHLPERSADEVRAALGNGSRYLIEHSVPDGTPSALVEQILSFYGPWYTAHSRIKTRPYPGIPELMQRLRAEGLRLAIISNKPDSAVPALAEENFPGLLELAVGEREGVRRKPSPDMIFKAVEGLQLPLSRCLYVGDSEVDLATARAAGIDCVSVTWGFRTSAQLREAGATVLVDTAEALGNWILSR